MKDKTKKYLIEEFEELRQEMVIKGFELGLNHPYVIELSQRIDLIHIEMIKIEEKRRYNNCTGEKWITKIKEDIWFGIGEIYSI